jgi:hypothetical protein
MSVSFKYTIVSLDEDLLNSLGAQGWRVAHVIPAVPASGDHPDNAQGSVRLLLELRGDDDDDDAVAIDKDAVRQMLGELFGHGGTLPPGV